MRGGEGPARDHRHRCQSGLNCVDRIPILKLGDALLVTIQKVSIANGACWPGCTLVTVGRDSAHPFEVQLT